MAAPFRGPAGRPSHPPGNAVLPGNTPKRLITISGSCGNSAAEGIQRDRTGAANMPETVRFTLDGQEVAASQDETIWQVANRLGNELPHLCHSPEPGYRSDGNCRACMVEIDGERTLAASCIRKPSDGMVVQSQTGRARRARRMVVELLVSDQPDHEIAHDVSSHLWRTAEAVGAGAGRFPRIEQARVPVLDGSHPAMRVNLDACIHCGLCVRACREVQVNDVIGMAGRGHDSRIVFDFSDPMGQSTCVACGECVQACPTGALMPSSMLDGQERGDSRDFEEEVNSICPFCGVGCQVSMKVKDGRIRYVDGADGPANEKRLCVKGRFGYDYVYHPHRLTKPLIRREDAPPKSLDVDPANPWTHFREASWDEALDLAAGGMKQLGERHGGSAIAGFGSAKCTNEEAYLFQKLIRQGFGHNNVDHCTRLCHASSVAALMENIGSGAVTATFNEIENADVAIVIGANPVENHPVAATYFKQFAKRGGNLILMDPRGSQLSRHATRMLKFRPGTDVSMLNAIMHVIVEEGLFDRQYIDAYTENWEAERHSPFRVRPRKHVGDLRHRRRDTEVGRPRVRVGEGRNDLLGNGNFPAHPRDRQFALPDFTCAHVRPCRAPRDRAASAEGTEQCPGCVGRGADPDVPAGLPERQG